MAIVTINDSILTDIGDALRVHHGETRIETQRIPDMTPIVKVSKTTNALSFTERNGDYNTGLAEYDTVTIPGAASLQVTMAYQTEGTTYDWVQVMQGAGASASGTKYGGKTLTQTTLTFAGDSVTFFFKSDGSGGSYLGYYAEVTGYDADGNVLINEWKDVEVEVPNTFKPKDMANAIENIQGGGFDIKYTQVVLTSMGNGVIGPFNIYDYVDSFDNILGFVVRISTDTSNTVNTQTYLKGMKIWENQDGKFGSGYNTKVTAIQTDNNLTKTTALNESANPSVSGWHGLALMSDGKIAFAYYNSGSNYQSLTGETYTSWTAAYARIELIYI